MQIWSPLSRFVLPHAFGTAQTSDFQASPTWGFDHQPHFLASLACFHVEGCVVQR